MSVIHDRRTPAGWYSKALLGGMVRNCSPYYYGDTANIRMYFTFSSASTWTRHFFRLNQAVEFLCGNKAEPHGLVLKRGSPRVRRFGDLGSIVITDPGRKRGDEHQRASHQFVDALLVGAQPCNAVRGK